jgi:NAD(P)-dependent dehydrogenase (short-subunit alcohol dehydrogenase family)
VTVNQLSKVRETHAPFFTKQRQQMQSNLDAQQTKVMLITGATGSIGSEVARHAVLSGWHVALHGRTLKRVEQTAAQLKPGDAYTAFAADVAKEEVASMIERVGARLGRIDAVVDCVSTGPQGVIGRFPATDPAAYAALYDLSIAHVQRLAHATLPWLQREGGADCVCI